jgi:outer membrane protein assembly factor BamB
LTDGGQGKVTVKWAFNTGCGVENSSPAIGADGTIYVGALCSTVFAVNSDGSKKWSFGSDEVLASPTIGADGTIYVHSTSNVLYALTDKGQNSVSQKWVFESGTATSPYSSPAIGADGTIYVACAPGICALTDGGPGTVLQKWSFTGINQSVAATPAIGADGTIYVLDEYGVLSALTDNGGNATVKWTFPTGGNGASGSSPALGADGTIYIGGEPTLLYALTDGGQGVVTQKWAFAGSGMGAGLSSPAIGADGTIYIGSLDEDLYGVGTGLTFANPRVADTANKRIVEFVPPLKGDTNFENPGLTLGTFGSCSGLTTGCLNCPEGVSVAMGGSVFVADSGNNRALEYLLPIFNGGTPSVVFGQPNFSLSTRFAAPVVSIPCNPTSTAIDSTGHFGFPISGSVAFLDSRNRSATVCPRIWSSAKATLDQAVVPTLRRTSSVSPLRSPSMP